MLDTKQRLKPVGRYDDRELISMLGLSGKVELNEFVYKERKIKERYILVEDIEEMVGDIRIEDVEYRLINETDIRCYYISSDAKVFTVKKKGKTKTFLKQKLDHRGHLSVCLNRKIYSVKNLLAKYFIKGWHPGCIVVLKDGDEFNLSLTNIQIYSRSEWSRILQNNRVCQPVGLYENGKLKKRYPSISDAAKDLYVDSKSLCRILQGKAKNKTYDIRKLS